MKMYGVTPETFREITAPLKAKKKLYSDQIQKIFPKHQKIRKLHYFHIKNLPPYSSSIFKQGVNVHQSHLHIGFS